MPKSNSDTTRRALLYNRETQEITEVQYSDWQPFYRFVNTDVLQPAPFCVGHDCLVDEEGLFKEGLLGTFVPGHADPLFGNIVIVGEVDYDKAEHGDALLSIEEARNLLSPVPLTTRSFR